MLRHGKNKGLGYSPLDSFQNSLRLGLYTPDKGLYSCVSGRGKHETKTKGRIMSFNSQVNELVSEFNKVSRELDKAIATEKWEQGGRSRARKEVAFGLFRALKIGIAPLVSMGIVIIDECDLARVVADKPQAVIEWNELSDHCFVSVCGRFEIVSMSFDGDEIEYSLAVDGNGHEVYTSPADAKRAAEVFLGKS